MLLQTFIADRKLTLSVSSREHDYELTITYPAYAESELTLYVDGIPIVNPSRYANRIFERLRFIYVISKRTLDRAAFGPDTEKRAAEKLINGAIQ